MSDKPRKNRNRQFDFTKYAKRHVALIVAYLGWDYNGLVVQETTEKTIETELFRALEKVKLVENRETASYQRCGRTDKGVSAFGQVISLDVRSNLCSGRGVFIPQGYTSKQASTSDAVNGADCNPNINKEETNYPMVINRVLPTDIRVLAWAPVDEGFSARFNCTKRVYKYLFPKGTLDLQAMRSAADSLIGTHDFRNFCRLDRDKSKVQTTVREIKDVSLNYLNDTDRFRSVKDAYSMCELTVTGSGFLYHQIRYTVAVLFAVGEGKESPEIVKALLDVDKVPRKPVYDMVTDFPLCLFQCSYEDYDLQWNWDRETLQLCVMKHLQSKWVEHSVKATMIKSMIKSLQQQAGDSLDDLNLTDSLYSMPRAKNHVPFLQRPTTDNVDDVQEKRAKKQKVLEAEKTVLSTNSICKLSDPVFKKQKLAEN